MSTLEELRAPAAYLFLVYASCFLLYIVVPGRRVSGYVRNARGKPLLYRLNGLRVFLLTICVTGCACYLSNTSFTLASSHRMSCCVWACLLGLVVSSLFYLKGPFEEHMSAHSVPASRDVGDFKNFRKAARIFFNGWELNPCLGLIDFKMFFYLAGATMLEINVLSGLVYHYSTFQEISWPLIVYCCEMTWFLVDYVYHEHVQLYTYDLFAENVGFKLAWGCLCFYPYFYSIGLPVLYQAKQGDVPYLYYVLIISIVVFIVGYVLSRGANNQKYKFKIDQKVKKYGFIEQRSIGVWVWFFVDRIWLNRTLMCRASCWCLDFGVYLGMSIILAKY